MNIVATKNSNQFTFDDDSRWHVIGTRGKTLFWQRSIVNLLGPFLAKTSHTISNMYINLGSDFAQNAGSTAKWALVNRSLAPTSTP